MRIKAIIASMGFLLLMPVVLLADYFNPCGIVVGKEAYFKISIKPNDYPDAKIAWQQSGTGRLTFVGGNTGRMVTVRGVTPGDITLSIQIGDARSSRPHFKARVIDESEVGVALWILTDGTNVSCSSEMAQNMFDKAREVWKQVGLDLQFRGLTVTNCPGMLRIVKDGKIGVHFSDIIAIGGYDADVINCYFVKEIYENSDHIGGLGGGLGVVVTKESGDLGLAHEIGHVYGLTDIYAENETHTLDVPVLRQMMPDDWNGGSGQRYYAGGTKLSTLLKRLLMYGEAGDGADITKGDVFGYWYEGNASDTNLVEKCSLAPIGYFKHLDEM